MEILQWVKKQTGKLTDNVKDYKFYVKSQPNFIDTSTTLFLTPFTNRDQLATVPCVYKWSRIKNGLLSEVPQFKGNSFICQPSDIGCIIQAQVTSTDGGHPGTAVLKFGPVKLDVLIKKQVEHALTSGSAVMNVDLVQKDQIKQCQIKITQQTIKISHCNSNNQYSFEYTLGQPRIQANPKQPNKAQIFFSQKYEEDVVKFTNSLFGFQDLSASSKQSNQKRIQLRFSNRALKDNFLLIVKAFNTKKAMRTSAVITKIENVDISNNDNFNYLLQIQSLRADLIKLARLNDKYLSEKRTYYQQARKLEKQIQEIIVTYTKIAEGKCRNQSQLDQSVMQLRQKRDQVMQRKLHALMRENQTLRDRIQFINEQMAQKEGGVIRVHSPGNEQQASSPRGGFIKKRAVLEVPVNAFDNILDKLNQSQVKDPVQQDKIMLAKKLNQSVVKIAKLEQKIKQMKHNQTVMNLNNSQISNLSVEQNKKLNLTSIQLSSTQKERFCAEIDELRRKNMKLNQENQKLKSQRPLDSSYQQINQDAGSQRSGVNKFREEQSSQILKSPKSQKPFLNLQHPKASTLQYEKQLRLKIQQLTTENEKLKQEIQRINIQKQIILKQKSALQAKYKRKMGELANQNSMYKRNQDALNRSQNLSMQMQAYNQQQTNLLKQQNDVLLNQNLKINAMYNKAMQQLKVLKKLRQENLRLTAAMNNFANKEHNGEISYEKSQDQINL